MQRHDLIAAMNELGLKGMAAAYDDVVTSGIKRQRDVTEILGDLIKAEGAERRMRSIRYRLGAAKLPIAKDLESFVFDGTPINAELVRALHGGSFLADKRNIILIGGTGSGKSHLCIAITANVIRSGARGRFFNVVDWSIAWRLKRGPARLGCWPGNWRASMSSRSMNLAICRLRNRPDSCCFI